MKVMTTALASLLVWASLANVAMPQTSGEAGSSAGLQQDPLDVLVVAPHSDDEAIGCTVVMLRAIKEGKRVGVVVVTNGDGFPKAAAVVAKKPQDQLTPADFIKLTGIRQQHSMTAMSRIGVQAADLIYLGYPDAGLKQVYAAEGPVPFRQKFTQKNETYGVVLSDYHSRIHGHPAPYLKASVVGDMTEIIKARKPKEIYVTNEADVHDEHEASFWIVRDAARATEWHGTIFTYLVHGHTLPQGPVRRLRLTAEELEKKRATIEEYQKHLSPIHDNLADHFTKPEEVFWPIRIAPPWHIGALGPDAATIDPLSLPRAKQVWEPKGTPPGAETRPYRCRIVSYADKWTRHGLSNYMTWRLPNGPLTKRQQWEIPWEEKLTYKQDFDVDGDGQTQDDFVAAHLFRFDKPLSNPRWPMHMAYPERINEIFYGGAAWYLADTKPGQHSVWVEQGYNPDHTGAWFDRRAEDHPLQGQSDEHEIESRVRVYWAILWKKEDFLNNVGSHRVTFDEESQLAALTMRTYWLGYDDVRLIARDGDQLYISDTSQYTVPVRGYPAGANGCVFRVRPTEVTWAEYNPKGHLIHFEPGEATFNKHEFKDVQAVGWYLAKHSLETGTQAHVKWYGFEADAVVYRPEQPSVHIAMAEVAGDQRVPAFWISTCEVPYALWKRIHRWGNVPFNTLQERYVYRKFGDMGSMLFEPDNSERPFNQDEPVTNITLYDALAWCNTLSEYEGKTPCYYLDAEFGEVFKNQHLWTRSKLDEEGEQTEQLASVPEPKLYVKWDADGHRLPTEAEWRAAFQAGKTTADPTSAIIVANSNRKTVKVGSGKSNRLGMYDMIGNVWELVWDYGDVFDPKVYKKVTLLGGDFNYPGNPAAAQNAASPYGDLPFDGGGNIGLRLVCRRAGQKKPVAGGTPPPDGYSAAGVPTWVVTKGERTAQRTQPALVKQSVLEMVSIPGGASRSADQPLKMARCAVSFGKWNRVCQWALARGYSFSHTGDMGSMYWYLFDHSPREPVTHITWFDMIAWCNALSEMEGRTPCYTTDAEGTRAYREAFVFRPARMSGQEAANLGSLAKFRPYVQTATGAAGAVYTQWDADGYRLPTLAEYELAARGGSRSRDYWGNENRNEYSWSIFNAGGRTHPVGLKKPNGYGLYDINGNVTQAVHGGGRGGSAAAPSRAARPLMAGDSFLCNYYQDWDPAPEMYFPDHGFRVMRQEPGTSQELVQRRRQVPSADQVAPVPWVDVATDACWRGNLRRTGEYETQGVPNLGGLKWKFPTGGKVRSEPVAFDGVVYIGSDGGNFHAVDVATGKEVWKIAVEGGVRSSACVAGGTVYFGGNDGKLYAADATTGEITWTVEGRRYLASSPAVAHGMVFMGGPIGLDLKTGKQLWGPDGRRLSGSRRAVNSSVAIVDRYLVENGGPCDIRTGRFRFGGDYWDRWETDAVADGARCCCVRRPSTTASSTLVPIMANSLRLTPSRTRTCGRWT